MTATCGLNSEGPFRGFGLGENHGEPPVRPTPDAPTCGNKLVVRSGPTRSLLPRQHLLLGNVLSAFDQALLRKFFWANIASSKAVACLWHSPWPDIAAKSVGPCPRLAVSRHRLRQRHACTHHAEILMISKARAASLRLGKRLREPPVRQLLWSCLVRSVEAAAMWRTGARGWLCGVEWSGDGCWSCGV